MTVTGTCANPRPDSDSVHRTAVAVTIMPSTASGTIQASDGSTAPVFRATSLMASNDNPKVQAAMLRNPMRASQTVMRSMLGLQTMKANADTARCKSAQVPPNAM